MNCGNQDNTDHLSDKWPIPAYNFELQQMEIRYLTMEEMEERGWELKDGIPV
jgi:hypothetical protein